MKTNDLVRLQDVAGLRLDARLGALRRAAERRDALQRQLDDVARTMRLARSVDLPERSAALLYEAWAEKRRMTLNLELARQNAVMEELREEAARAFGQNEAVGALRERLREENRQELLRR